MNVIEALSRCDGSDGAKRHLCCRPVAWNGSGDGCAFIVRSEQGGRGRGYIKRIRYADDPGDVAVLACNDFELLAGEWEVLTLNALRKEQIQFETGVDCGG